MIDILQIPVDHYIYVVPGDKTVLSGIGTKDKPFILPFGDMDSLLGIRDKTLHITFAPGNYTTNGFYIPGLKTLLMQGSGVGKTVIKLLNGAKNHFFPHIRMITDGGEYFTHFACRDMTLDGNWSEQPEHANSKVAALAIEALVCLLENVDVINCGANGSAEGQKGLETMPISAQTVANGDLQHYIQGMHYLHGAEPTTRLEIINCRVGNSHYKVGGTGTGIYIRTNSPANRQPIGTRTTKAALVKDCTVINPGGICYGGADLDMVDYINNRGTGMCAFNVDTLAAHRVTIEGNRFTKCNTGINISPSGNGSQIAIRNNVIHVINAFKNEVLNRFEPQWGIRSLYTEKSFAEHNTIFYENPILTMEGITGLDNLFVLLGSKTFTDLQPEVDRLNAALIAMTQLQTDTAKVAAKYLETVSAIKSIILS